MHALKNYIDLRKNKNLEAIFWLLFLILNSLLFAPQYLIEADTSHFIPYQFLHESGWYYKIKYLFNRDNFDIFRLSFDFIILLLLIRVFKNRIRNTNNISTFLFVLYMIWFIHHIYYSAFYHIYSVNPLLFNDWSLIKTGFQIFFHDHLWMTVSILLGFIAISVIIYFSFQHLIRCMVVFKASIFTYVFSSLIFLVTGYSLFRYGVDHKPEYTLQFTSKLLVSNIIGSIKYKQLSNNLSMKNVGMLDYLDQQALLEKPPLFLIFIESYGRILYDIDSLEKKYKKILACKESLLDDHQWHSTTTLSRSPVQGGASWISYSNVIYGFNFKNSGVYNFLLNHESFCRFRHLLNFLQNKGYKNYRLSSIYPHENMPIPWDKYTRFYAVDEWIKYNDLDYSGKLYGFGPAPPDQYALNYAHNYIREQQQDDPFTLFMITQNSHNPFYSPTEIAEDWETLKNDKGLHRQKSVFMQKPELHDYMNAIEYQLDFLIDFIVKYNGNAVFLLTGDHQPPELETFGKPETPMHIISKDSSFIASFSDYGLKQGLTCSDSSANFKHEAFYSMFIRAFIGAYGKADTIPSFHPDGFDIFKGSNL